MGEAFILTYGAVFAAELVGDKLLYTTTVLAARYRAVPIVFGATLACMVKMGVAVLVGAAVSRMPRLFVAGVTAASFILVAVALWRKPYESGPLAESRDPSGGAWTSFVVVLLSEWADLGQVTTAMMAARFASPLAVWSGGVSAMATKGILAAWLGAGVRRWLHGRLSPRTVRYGSVILLLLLGGLSVAESLLGPR